MNPIGIVRTTVGIATSLGAGTVLGNIVKATTPVQTKMLEKILIRIGSAALGMTVGDLVSQHTMRVVDTTVENFQGASKKKQDENEED